MSETKLQTFEEGDELEIRNYRYRVNRVEFREDGSILRYVLGPLGENTPPADLHPDETWGKFTFTPTVPVGDDEIQVDNKWMCPNCGSEFGNESARRDDPEGVRCFKCSTWGPIT